MGQETETIQVLKKIRQTHLEKCANEQSSVFLTVRLGDTLELVLLLDGVAVAGSLGGVDQLIGQALCDGLDVPERGLTGSGAQQPDSLKKNYTLKLIHESLHTR